MNAGELIEALRGEATPDGWDPTSGCAYVRELWVDSAAAAMQINAALAMVPRIDDLIRAEKRIADLEAQRARLRHIMLGLTIIEKMEAKADADEEEARIRADEAAKWAARVRELEADLASESARLRTELSRNVLPSQHEFIDDPHHADQCRQHVIYPGDVGRCCGYSRSEHHTPDRSHSERRLAALRAEKKARLRQEYGVQLCEACSTILRDDAPRVACEDCTLCPGCAAELESTPATEAAEGGAT